MLREYCVTVVIDKEWVPEWNARGVEKNVKKGKMISIVSSNNRWKTMVFVCVEVPWLSDNGEQWKRIKLLRSIRRHRNSDSSWSISNLSTISVIEISTFLRILRSRRTLLDSRNTYACRDSNLCSNYTFDWIWMRINWKMSVLTSNQFLDIKIWNVFFFSKVKTLNLSLYVNFVQKSSYRINFVTRIFTISSLQKF